MAKRVVDVEFWKDEKVELFTPESKYFWLFLLTNPNTTQCGIYHITLKQMSFYLGYDTETCKKLIDRFEKEYKVIKYVDNEMAIKNYLKFAIVKGGLPVEQQINRELRAVKNKELIAWVFANLETKKENLTQTIINILNNKKEYIDDNAYANACTDNVRGTYAEHKQTEKHKYGTYKNVLLSDIELETLKKEFPNDWQERIERVSAYCASTGKTYKNYLATIRVWAKKDKPTKQVNDLPTYSTENNKKLSKKEADELLKLMGKDNK